MPLLNASLYYLSFPVHVGWYASSYSRVMEKTPRKGLTVYNRGHRNTVINERTHELPRWTGRTDWPVWPCVYRQCSASHKPEPVSSTLQSNSPTRARARTFRVHVRLYSRSATRHFSYYVNRVIQNGHRHT